MNPSQARSTLPLVLILNPTAGKGRAGRELVHLRTLVDRRVEKADIFLTREEGDATRLVQELDLIPGTVVVAAGGDGTVHEVGVALLGREDVSLGVIPFGSGNDYAGVLGMPNDLTSALDAILEGRDQSWDVGMVGSEPFLNTVGFAFSASVSNYSRNTGSLRGFARYGFAIARALKGHRPSMLGFDGLEASGDHRITLMEVGIGDRCGGGFRLTHLAHPSDGLLDVCIVKAMPRWRLPLLLPKGMKGKHVGHPAVIYERVPSFRLRLGAQTMIHVDGEIRALQRGEHTVKVQPKALRVRVARERARELERRQEGAS